MGPNIRKTDTAAVQRAKVLFHSQSGAFRTGEAMKAGIHPRTLCAMRDQGALEQLGRGMHRFANMPGIRNPDLATVALKITKGVICLISALSWHEMTSEIPHEIYLPGCAAQNRLAWRILLSGSSGFKETHLPQQFPVKM